MCASTALTISWLLATRGTSRSLAPDWLRGLPDTTQRRCALESASRATLPFSGLNDKFYNTVSALSYKARLFSIDTTAGACYKVRVRRVTEATELYVEIGRRIAACRSERGISQGQLAKQC